MKTIEDMYDIRVITLQNEIMMDRYRARSFDEVREQHKPAVAMLMAAVEPNGTAYIKSVGDIRDYGMAGPLIYLFEKPHGDD
jgi:hypothetical protein